LAEPRPYPTQAPTQFSLATRRQRGTVVVEVEGELDVLSCGRLQESLLHLLDGGERDVVLDLARLRFCDATGLSTFAAGIERFRRNHGELRLREPRDDVRRMLDDAELEVEFVLDDSPAAPRPASRTAS
jgi:anti-sigma B factor antagonist